MIVHFQIFRPDFDFHILCAFRRLGDTTRRYRTFMWQSVSIEHPEKMSRPGVGFSAARFGP
jgi:hypothetical protein